MVAPKKNKRRSKKKSTNKQVFFPGVGRLLLFFLLFATLIFSLCSAGYVIFFRTVFAQEIMPSLRDNIVFEEPNPPSIEDTQIKEIPTTDLVADTVNSIVQETALPRVAIIIDDIGYQYEMGMRVLALPIECTFSFLPFAPFTRQLEESAHSRGKTVFLHLPLEPQSADFNPGPGALMLSDSPETQREKLQRSLDEVPHAVGVNNHMGSLYTEDKIAMERLMVELSNRSLMFIDSYTTALSVGLDSARSMGLKSARRHVFLDNKLTKEHICGQLEKLVHIANENGVAIGIGHPHGETLDALTSCSPIYASQVQYVSIPEIL